MTTKVYVWTLSSANVGHVSLLVGTEYMSYWPSQPAGKKDFKIGQTHAPAFPSSYKVDKRLEGKESDHKVEINGLNEALMIDTWNQFKSSPDRYNMVSKNCSTVAAWMLEIGSGLSPNVDKGIQIDRWAPNNLMRFILKLRYLGNHIDMWTPDAAWTYALQVKSYLDSK